MDRNYIRGFFDGEGTVGLYTRGFNEHHQALQPRIALANNCIPILEAISEFLKHEGYHPTIKRNSGQCYTLNLRRWNDILRFIDEIGTNHPDKQSIFDKVRSYSRVARKTRRRLISVKQLETLFGENNGI